MTFNIPSLVQPDEFFVYFLSVFSHDHILDFSNINVFGASTECDDASMAISYRIQSVHRLDRYGSNRDFYIRPPVQNLLQWLGHHNAPVESVLVRPDEFLEKMSSSFPLFPHHIWIFNINDTTSHIFVAHHNKYSHIC